MQNTQSSLKTSRRKQENSQCNGILEAARKDKSLEELFQIPLLIGSKKRSLSFIGKIAATLRKLTNQERLETGVEGAKLPRLSEFWKKAVVKKIR